jgi:hypothetical protein
MRRAARCSGIRVRQRRRTARREREFADAIVGLADLPERLISRSGPFRRLAYGSKWQAGHEHPRQPVKAAEQTHDCVIPVLALIPNAQYYIAALEMLLSVPPFPLQPDSKSRPRG